MVVVFNSKYRVHAFNIVSACIAVTLKVNDSDDNIDCPDI